MQVLFCVVRFRLDPIWVVYGVSIDRAIMGEAMPEQGAEGDARRGHWPMPSAKSSEAAAMSTSLRVSPPESCVVSRRVTLL